MPGSATLAVEQQVLAHTLAFGAMTAPTGVFLALCQAAPPPTAAAGGLEIIGNGYQRQAVTFALIAPPPTIAANTTTVVFPAATANWGSIGWFEIWSAITAGMRLYWGPLVDPIDGVTNLTRTVLAGDIVRFTAGVIQVQAT